MFWDRISVLFKSIHVGFTATQNTCDRYNKFVIDNLKIILCMIGNYLLLCWHNFGNNFCENNSRTSRHDALVNIIYNALSQDHPGVLKEQRVSYDDGSRPGDVFHPDGYSAFFDISECSTALFLHLLHVLGWQLLLGRLPRMRNIWQLWRRLGLILFPWWWKLWGFGHHLL